MKNFADLSFKALFISIGLFCHISLAADPLEGGKTIGSNKMQTTPPLLNPKPTATPSKGPAPHINVKSTPLAPQVAAYLHPGVIFFRNGQWEGGDHLLNLTNNIGVFVTIVKPEKDPLPIAEDDLKKVVEEAFRAVNINPVTLTAPGEPPLPAFQIQVLAYPIDKGYVVACEGRLFEAVTLARFTLDPGMAFQAVTWEKKSLQVGPTDKIAEQIKGCVGEIAGSFAERFEAYERRRKDLK